MNDLDALRSFATIRQLEIIDAIQLHGSSNKASKVLGIGRRTVDQALLSLKNKAARYGHSPAHDMTHTVPDGYVVKGVSTYYGDDGKPRGQWVKSSIDQQRQEALMREALEVMADGLKGLSPIIKPPKHVSESLLCAIPIGDPHFGMLAWGRETGADFDSDIAKRITASAIDRVVSTAPNASTAILLPLGDVFHADDQSNQTPAHKHQLDVDSRFVKVVGVVIESYRHAILRMLEKFGKVIVRFVPGNHDPHAIWALAYAIAAYFHNDKRVVVDLSPSKFWYFSFGKVLIGATHGDTVKHDKLPGVMAADKPQEWGLSRHRYWYTGHVHTKAVSEYPGVVCESFRTLAPSDAWSAGHGYRSGRDMQLIVHHAEHGEIERHRVDIGMIEP